MSALQRDLKFDSAIRSASRPGVVAVNWQFFTHADRVELICADASIYQVVYDSLRSGPRQFEVHFGFAEAVCMSDDSNLSDPRTREHNFCNSIEQPK